MVEDFEITTAGKLLRGRTEFKKWVVLFLSSMQNSHLYGKLGMVS